MMSVGAERRGIFPFGLARKSFHPFFQRPPSPYDLTDMPSASLKRSRPSTSTLAKPSIKKQKKQALPPVSNRPTASASDEDDDDSQSLLGGDEEEDDNKDVMLKMLEAHGRAMFGEVALPLASSADKGKGRALVVELEEEDNEGDEEWDDEDGEEYSEDEDDGEDEGSVGDDGEVIGATTSLAAGHSGTRAPEVVFAPQVGRSQSSNADYRSFMVSSFVSLPSRPRLRLLLTDCTSRTLLVELESLQGCLWTYYLDRRHQEGARRREVRIFSPFPFLRPLCGLAEANLLPIYLPCAGPISPSTRPFTLSSSPSSYRPLSTRTPHLPFEDD
jgi:hypothetical protein